MTDPDPKSAFFAPGPVLDSEHSVTGAGGAPPGGGGGRGATGGWSGPPQAPAASFPRSKVARVRSGFRRARSRRGSITPPSLALSPSPVPLRPPHTQIHPLHTQRYRKTRGARYRQPSVSHEPPRVTDAFSPRPLPVQVLACGVQGLGFRVQGLVFGVWGLGFRI